MKINICLVFSLALFQLKSYSQDLKTGISAHDPAMIRQDSTYYLFSTGRGINVWSSKDRVHWKQEKRVFDAAPKWALDSVKGFNNHIWAPDISWYNGKYYLYYSVSMFGKNTSCIGVATNATLNPEDPAFHWTDHGMVIQSVPGKNNWNAIDPNLILGKDGSPYLAFGSFWDGIKVLKLKKDGLSPDEPLNNLQTLAKRPREVAGNPIEAPFVFRKGKYYYLFCSIDYCCKAAASTYKMIAGRSENVLGPYLDEDGRALNSGGGSLILQGNKDWYGVGHNAVCTFEGEDYLVFHGYDANDNSRPKLILRHLNWERDWPRAESL